ncbi:MAG: hypothetical protein LWW91_08370 [Bacteroidales bacterium]|nr:hypothetical protein [Bacteroidales bacterium]
MKKFMFSLFVLCLMSLFATAQSDSIPTVVIKRFTYCEIIGTSGLAGSKVTVDIDFGQKTKIFSDTRLKDKDGKPIKFNSLIDALNYMGNDGWELVQVFTSTYSADTYKYHYLLKKEITK